MKNVAVLGCGNWGTTIANLIAKGIDENVFRKEVKMYVHDIIVEYDGKKQHLSTFINEQHKNPKYLPDITLEENVVAVTEFSDLADTDILVICVPHQFLKSVRGVFEFITQKESLVLINLAKGMIFEKSLITPSEYVSQLVGIKCSSLQGANIAHEVADELYSETLIGCHDEYEQKLFERLFTKPHFKPKFIDYNPTMEVFGALKNVVSFAYGIIEGIIEKGCNDYISVRFGSNTKVVILRKGIEEMLKFIKEEGYKNGPELFLETCGLADLLVSCEAGRNKMCGAKICDALNECKNGHLKLSEVLENYFGGQKIQGMDTVKTLYEYLESKNKQHEYMLITMLYELLFGTCDLSPLYEYL